MDIWGELPDSSHSQSQIHEDSYTSEGDDDESSSEGTLSAGGDSEQNHEGGPQKKKRGPTRCLHIQRSTSKGNRIPITLNAYGQPNGPCSKNVNKLSSYLGILARNWNLLPLTYVSWRVVPNKEDVWELVKTKFDIDERAKKWVFQATGQDWRGYKSRLKKKYFTKFKTNDIRIANCPPGVPKDKWEVMVLYWSNPSTKALSRKNKVSRSYQVNMHRTGSRPFALIREEERGKRPNKTEPSLEEMFYLTRKCKEFDDKTMKKIADYNALSSQIDETSDNSTARDELFSQVMGEKPGRARLFGTGVSRTDVMTSLTTAVRVTTEARRLTDIEVQDYKKETEEKFIEMDKKIKQADEKIKERDDRFNALVSWMKTKFPGEDIPSDIIEETTPLYKAIQAESITREKMG